MDRHPIIAALCACILTVGLSAGEASAQTKSTASGITAPSQRLKLTFYGAGVVKETHVKEGDRVTKDQVLVSQDDRLDKKALEGILIEANSTLQIDAAKADLEQKKVDLGRKERAFAAGAGSESEVEEAKLAVLIDEIRIKLAEQEKQTKMMEAAKQELKIELLQMKSPIDGIVKKMNVGPGELGDPQNRDGSVVLVKNDPLWVEIYLPREQAAQIQLGQPMDVQYPKEPAWISAKMIYRDPEADAASGMQLIRLEMANPESRDAGSQVTVKLPDKLAGANP